jgi:hypothetical protein
MGEEVPQQVDIGQAVAEALGHHPSWQPLDKGGAQGFVTALPLVDGLQEEVFIAHANAYKI